MSRDPATDPQPGDRIMLPRGAVRVDFIEKGQVYFHLWRRAGIEGEGEAIRMEPALFAAAIAHERSQSGDVMLDPIEVRHVR